MKDLFDAENGTNIIDIKALESSEDSVVAEYSTAMHAIDRPTEIDEPYIVFEIGDSVRQPLLRQYEEVSLFEENDYAVLSIEDRNRIREVYPKPRRATIPVIGEDLDVM